MPSQSLKDRYLSLVTEREPFLKRAREFAALTLPSVMPPQGHRYTSDLPVPYQGLGARGVKHLAALLTKAFLPTGRGFFRLDVAAEVLLKEGLQEAPDDMRKPLALVERAIGAEIERRRWRQPTYLGLQHLIVTGNALEQMLPDNTIRILRLDQYVVLRDPAGNLVECVIEEVVSPYALPEALRSAVSARRIAEGNVASGEDPLARTVEIYTGYRRTPDGGFEAWQEVSDIEVPGSRGTYGPTELPIAPLRWSELANESYGRGLIEELEGDLRAYEGLSKSMLDGSSMASRHVTLVRPNAAGGNLRQRVAKANNGDVLAGNPEDVTMLQFQNVQGLQITASELERIRQSLSASFMLTTDLRRDAERVTAEEIRMLVRELEEGLGGVYTLLSSDMQMARLRRLILQMQRAQQLPPWPEKVIEPTIVTGLEALEREADVSRVDAALDLLLKARQASDEAGDYVPIGPLLSKALTGLGLPGDVRSESDVQALRQQRAQMQAQQQGMAAGMTAQAEAAAQPQPVQ